MKKHYLIFLFLLTLTKGFSQDTIMFKSREVHVAKIEEITPNEIIYRRFNNLSGPLFRVEKSKVAYIRLLNGVRDSLPEIKEPETVYVQPSLPDKITIDGTDLFLGNRRIHESTLLVLSNRVGPGPKQDRLKTKYREMQKLKTKMYTSLFLGVGMIFVIPFTLFLLDFDLQPKGLVILGSEVAWVGTGLGLSGYYKHKRKLKQVEFAKIYNE